VVEMWEILLAIASPAIAVLGTYIMGKRLMKNAIDEVEDLIFSIPQSEDGAKLLFSIGGLVGNGIKSGVGLNPRGGKFKWQDLLTGIAANWLENSGLIPQQAQSPQNQKIFNGPIQNSS